MTRVHISDLRDAWVAAGGEEYSLGNQCRICYWHPQVKRHGDWWQRSHKMMDAHERKHHPDLVEWRKTAPGWRELVDELHKDCTHVAEPCRCICGCQEEVWGTSCRSFGGFLCVVCSVRYMRGDCEHQEGSDES